MRYLSRTDRLIGRASNNRSFVRCVWIYTSRTAVFRLGGRGLIGRVILLQQQCPFVMYFDAGFLKLNLLTYKMAAGNRAERAHNLLALRIQINARSAALDGGSDSHRSVCIPEMISLRAFHFFLLLLPPFSSGGNENRWPLQIDGGFLKQR